MSIQNDYYNWMLSKIEHGVITERYEALLLHLHQTNFTYVRDSDGNRACDGVDLRYIFAYETGVPNSIIAYELDNGPCSVLEMMVALANRCEGIMADSEKGDRTHIWFWDMVKSMGLLAYSDRHFKGTQVKRILKACLRRDISDDGQGWFFALEDPPESLKHVDIWTAAMWYLDTIDD